jgi:hypothetical protein
MNNIFTDALLSDVPHSTIPQENRILEPFIGSWKLDRQMLGEWHFARALEGRAIQDVWITPSRQERNGQGEYGTILRFYNSDINAWRSTWIGPVNSVIYTFIARRVDDRVILESTDDMTLKMRWAFSDISSKLFRWNNEVWQDERWRIQQTFDAQRVRSF